MSYPVRRPGLRCFPFIIGSGGVGFPDMPPHDSGRGDFGNQKGDVMNVKSVFFSVVLCSVLAVLAGCGKGNAPDTAQATQSQADHGQVAAAVSDPVLVTVDGKTLTRSAAIDMARNFIASRGVPAQMLDSLMAKDGAQLLRQATERFINQTLLAAEAERRKIPISEETVDAVMADIEKRVPQGATLEQALAAQGTSIANLRAEITVKEQMRKVYEAETELPEPVTDEQVRAYYDENKESLTNPEQVEARHILIGCDESADVQKRDLARVEAEIVRKQLLDGADFAELAKEKSSCPSKERGGSLGSFGRGQMVEAFEKAAFSQEIGEIGPVVETRFGFHVIEVTGKTEAGIPSFEEASGRIREELTANAKRDRYALFLEKLREGADIKYGTNSPPSDS